MIHKAERGQKVQTMLFEPYMPFEVPVTILRGAHDGPVAVISGGVHSAEFVGIKAALELSEELTPEALHGTVVILPLMNRSGFEHRTMSMVWEDGKNLNRMFPGNPHGTAAERLAYGVFENIIRHADAYVDLHSGDGYEKLMPYAYYVVGENEAASKALADCCRTRYNVRSHFKNGGAYNVANQLGIAAILLERGGLSLYPREDVEADKEDVRNILRYMGILRGEPVLYEKRDLDRVLYRNAPETGCWTPHCEPGERFSKGTILGTITDYFGNILAEIPAEEDGMMLYETYSLNVLRDTPMVAYAAMEFKEEE